MRVAIAGLGGAATRGHLPAIRALESTGRLRLVAAADPIVERHATAVREFAGLPTFTGAEAMLDTVPCDLLVVATEPEAHPPLAVLGFRHRLHVLTEKPLALSSTDLCSVRAAQAAQPDLALVSVHQYQFSPVWARVVPWLRTASRLHAPFQLEVEVQRDGVDVSAASAWRSDSRLSGGILADHGTHFLALAWRIAWRLRALQADRQLQQDGRETATATVRVGRSGVLRLKLSANNGGRRTRLEAKALGAHLIWDDGTATVRVAGGPTLHRDAEALSDRAHVDALYPAVYRHLVAGVGDSAWRQRRLTETLAVAEACTSLLSLGDPGAGVTE